MKAILFSAVLFVFLQQSARSQETPHAVEGPSRDAVKTIDPKGDTARAVRNLFVRKQRGGTARAIIFGTLGTISLIGALTYQPEYVTIQGSGGTQRIDTGSSPDPAIYAFAAFNTVMMITGITQHRKYNGAMLRAVLENYEQVGALPPKIKSKLRKKDFGK